MAFRQEDFKKTSRKGSGDAPASVYPHQLKDKKTLARLEIAIRTFDGAVGKRRRDMDAQAMTDFFGDPRLARGIVACLGQFYKYETLDFAQAVGRDAAARLGAQGLTRPVEVRADTYAWVNAHANGFLTEAGRAEAYEQLGARFCLSAHQWDSLMHGDAEDNQVLSRLGGAPTPADITALYNFHSLDTVLRRATAITLHGLGLPAGEAADVRALAKSLGVRAVVSGDGATVTLTEAPPEARSTPATSRDPSLLGKGEDTSPTPPSLTGKGAGGLGSLFPRRAGRLVRCLLHLAAAYATRQTTGWVDAKIGARSFRLALGTDALRALGMPSKRAADGEKPMFRRRFEAGLALHKDLLKRRAKGEANGWRIKRLPDPLVTAVGVLLPDFTLSRGATTAHVLLCLPSPGTGEGAETPEASILPFPLGRKPLDAADVLARVESATSSLFALAPAGPPAVPADVRALCDRAAREGLVRAADARRTLHLLDESPLIAWVRQCEDPRVRYVPGVGLCSREMVQDMAAAIAGEPMPGEGLVRA
jgi:predicted nuclease of restriction endonuclease-like RecB superfamily